jgi:glycosyltransferase involved in cell wall biosynthesis
LPEVIGESGKTGVLVTPDDPEALLRAIRGLFDDPAARARLGAAGRQRVMERFTWEVTARGTAACYDAILTGRPLPESVTFA